MTELATKEVAPTVPIDTTAPQLPAVRQAHPPRKPARPAPFSPSIARAVLSVTKAIGVIQKGGFNDFQKYKYTRWEDINDKLSPLLAEHGLIVHQSEISRNLIEDNDKGSVLAIVYHFTLVHESGDQWPPVEWTAIARLRDAKGTTDDKAASKCHTSAEKQYCLKQFKIRSDENLIDGDKSPALPKKDARPVYQAMQDEMDRAARDAMESAELSSFLDWGRRNASRKKTFPADWQDILTTRFNDWVSQINASLQEMDEKHDAETGEIQ